MTIPCVSLDTTFDAPACTDCESSVPTVVGVRPRRSCRARGGSLALLVTLLAGWTGALTAGPATAASAERFPVTPEQRETAEKVASHGVALSDLAPNAPSSYTIKRGDTLWSIATIFLKSPWRWPELWGMNQAQIRNPHLIYPGQTLVLVKTAEGRAQLVLEGSEAAKQAAAPVPAPVVSAPEVPTEKMRPQVRDMGAEALAAIPSIPNNLIEPFLSLPLVVAAAGLDEYPRIVATPEDRFYLGLGDTAYARGIGNDNVETYHVFRPVRPLFDPDDVDQRSPIAFEADFVGTARVVKRGEVATLKILEAKREIGVDDRLVPIGHQQLINYVPRRTQADVQGRIVAVYGGELSAGAGNIVTLNRGSKDGLEIGSVLTVLHNGETVVDITQPGNEKIKLPDEPVGYVFVFRLFDGISYGLLVSATGPIAVGDRFAPPDAKPSAPEAPEPTVGPTS